MGSEQRTWKTVGIHGMSFYWIMFNGTAKPDEIMHLNEYSRFNGAVQYVKQLLINDLEKSKKLTSLLKKNQSAADIYEILHFVRITGTSMMQSIILLIALAHHDLKDTGSGKVIVKVRELQQEFIRREIVFHSILHISVFLMTLEP